MSLTVVRQTLSERYHGYLDSDKNLHDMLKNRINHLSREEVAHLLAYDDKFTRLSCAEYEEDETNPGRILLDPIGREVDLYGRLKK